MALFKERFEEDIELQSLIGNEFSSPPEQPTEDKSPESITEAGLSIDDIEPLRLMMLGSDSALMNEACDIISGLTQEVNARYAESCKFMEGKINGRQVSLVKTPSYWLEHLKSYVIFWNGVKSMRNDMKYHESLLFPGPHVFLLVLGDVHNSGKEHLLLKALSKVFGNEALDYCMVLFMRDYRDCDMRKNHCVVNCGNKYHVLQNTENLFQKIWTMIQKREKSYFTNDFALLEKTKKYYQRQFNAHFLKMETFRKELNDSKVNEMKLNVDLKVLQSEIKHLKATEQDLNKDLREMKAKEEFLLKQVQSECDIIQRNEELQAKETELSERQRELETRERELETRERHLAQRKTRSGGSEPEQDSRTMVPHPVDTFRLHVGDGAESSDGESHATGLDVTEGVKPVRRNSLQWEPPSMSESEHAPV